MEEQQALMLGRSPCLGICYCRWRVLGGMIFFLIIILYLKKKEEADCRENIY